MYGLSLRLSFMRTLLNGKCLWNKSLKRWKNISYDVLAQVESKTGDQSSWAISLENFSQAASVKHLLYINSGTMLVTFLILNCDGSRKWSVVTLCII